MYKNTQENNVEINIKELKELSKAGESQKTSSIKIGKSYLIRTVTMMYTGRVVSITDEDYVLEDAAWIADSGRYYNALKDGTLEEVEPYPDGVVVTRGSMVDAAEWTHPLPREQK